MKRYVAILLSLMLFNEAWAYVVNSTADVAPKVITAPKLSSSGQSVGAILHSSAANGVSWLAAPATGRLLGSQGVGIAPAWLTDPSVNSYTATGPTGLLLTGTPTASATSALAQIGATPVGGSSNGHMVNINAPSGFTGNLMRAQINGGTNVWNVNSSGGGYFAASVGFGAANPSAQVEIDQPDVTADTEKPSFRVSSTVQTLTSAAPATARHFMAIHPVFTAANSGLTIANAATFYIDQGPSASSAGGFTPTLTNSYALWVDSGTSRFDGDLSLQGANPGVTKILGTDSSGIVKGATLSGLTWDGTTLATTASGTYLPLAGGTMTGTINTQHLLPATNLTYDLGSGSFKFNNGYIDIINGSTAVWTGAIRAASYVVGASGAVALIASTGSPEGAQTADVGSVYQRTNGGASTSLYVKTSGSGNTGWKPLTTYLSGSATLDFANTAAQSSDDLSITVTGAAVGDQVVVGIPGSPDSNSNFTAWVNSADTVYVRFNNYSSGAINPASGTYTVKVFPQ